MLAFLVSTTANASKFNNETGDYRLQYNFSYEVFKDLEPFPEDFYEIKSLFETQQITASKLTKSYYQPEVLQSWNSTLKKIYEKNKQYENQGIFIYPSRFDIFNIHINDSLIISALIYAHPGVSTFQGTEIYFEYNETIVNVETLSNTTYVLGPTQPVFNSLWMQLIEFKISILDDKYNTTIKIRERNPSDEFNEKYKEKYGKQNYSECISLLSEKIDRCRIYIHSDYIPEKETVSSESNSFIIPFIPLLIGIIILIVILSLGLKYDKKKAEREKQWQK